MLTFEEYRKLDAHDLTDLIKTGQVQASELLESALHAAQHLNPEINAIVELLPEIGQKLASSTTKEMPFAGVPFLVKDLGFEIAGAPLRSGSRGYANYVSTEDSIAIQRIKAAGLMIFGKSNTPEFGLTPYTEPLSAGICRNPWNTNHTPGGSSGGSAAAVAAGICPIASANDGGGSIRMPASSCGLFGMKPSRGRISWAPFAGEGWSGAEEEGCVSKSVRDSARYLDVVSGPTPFDVYQVPKPEVPYSEELKKEPGKLRIAFSKQHTLGHEVHPECLAAMDHTLKLLQSLGHEVEEVPLPFFKEDLTKAFLVMVAAEVAAELDRMKSHLGRKVRLNDVEPNTYALHLLGRTFRADELTTAKRKWYEISARLVRMHQQYDVFLTPTLASPPIKVGALQPKPHEALLVRIVNTFHLGGLAKASIDQLAEQIYDYMPWTIMANISGQPSMSVPLHWSAAGLPVGSLFTAQQGQEGLLFRLAAQLEQAQPWKHRYEDLPLWK
jgi:amidase